MKRVIFLSALLLLFNKVVDMKVHFYTIIVCLCCLFLISCKQDPKQEFNEHEYEHEPNENEEEVCACGVSAPAKNLPWLAELIEKAETDKTGHYLGCIWLEKYKGQDIFITNMMLGSGGAMHWYFDCSGNHFVFSRGEGSYCPSAFVGGGHFYVEDEADFGIAMRKRFDVNIYSPFPFKCYPYK